MSNKALEEEQAKQIEIENAEACGLTYTGDDKVPFIGDNRAWARFDDGDFN